MNLQSIKHDILYGIITAVIVALLYYALPNRSVQPHGILTPAQATTNALPPTVQDIPVLSEYPAQYQTIGNIIVTMALTHNTESALNSNLEQCKNKAKDLAREAGAKAVIILRAGHYNKNMGMNSTVLYAQALL